MLNINGIDLNSIKMLTIRGECIESLPCQHSCRIVFNDGTSRNITLDATEIRGIFLDRLDPSKINNKCGRPHFSPQSQPCSPFMSQNVSKKELAGLKFL